MRIARTLPSLLFIWFCVASCAPPRPAPTAEGARAPEEAANEREEGTVFVKLTFDQNGVAMARVMKGPGALREDCVKRLLATHPTGEPGTSRVKSCKYTIDK